MLHSTAASSAKQPPGQRKTGAFIFLNAPMMTVKEISDLCGYGNEICFMKIFKKMNLQVFSNLKTQKYYPIIFIIFILGNMKS